MATKTNGRERAERREEPDAADLPPQDLVAERACLGGCLLHVPALDEALEILRPEHFYSEKHRFLFSALRDMRTSGKTAIDALIVLEFLKSTGHLEDAGGPELVLGCMETVPHSAHTGHYARIVLERAQRRTADFMFRNGIREIRDPSNPTDEILRNAEQALHKAMDESLVSAPVGIGEVLAEAMAEIASGGHKKRMAETSFNSIDEVAVGLPYGGVTILAARPSAGKTSLACSLAIALAESGLSVLFVSYEQPRIEIAERFLCIQSGLSFWQVRHNRLMENERQRLLDSAAELQAMQIAFDCECRPQSQLISMLRSQVYRRKLQVAVIDYLQLVEPDDRGMNREQQVAGISRALKRVAMQTGVALIVLSQLNRDVERREIKQPRLSDLRESGSIEQDADQVWLLHRPNAGRGLEESPADPKAGKPSELKDDDFAELYIAKNRNGPTGTVRLNWSPASMTYSDPKTINAATIF